MFKCNNLSSKLFYKRKFVVNFNKAKKCLFNFIKNSFYSVYNFLLSIIYDDEVNVFFLSSKKESDYWHLSNKKCLRVKGLDISSIMFGLEKGLFGNFFLVNKIPYSKNALLKKMKKLYPTVQHLRYNASDIGKLEFIKSNVAV